MQWRAQRRAVCTTLRIDQPVRALAEAAHDGRGEHDREVRLDRLALAAVPTWRVLGKLWPADMPEGAAENAQSGSLSLPFSLLPSDSDVRAERTTLTVTPSE